MSSHARLALAAAACALLAGWLTFNYAAKADRRDGPRVTVLVAARELKAGSAVDEAVAGALESRSVPARFAPPDALTDPADAIGARVVGDLAAGSYVTRSALAGGSADAPAFRLRTGERAVTVDVTVSPAGSLLAAGDRVDLFASGFGGDEHTTELLDGAEVLQADESGDSGRSRATLRLAAAQVAPVIRADVFAHELRAVARPAS